MPSQREKSDLRARQFVVVIVLGLFFTRVLAPWEPLWALALFLAIVGISVWAVLMAVRARRERRDRAWNGLCLHCGYDVRAVEGPLCPEYGKPSRRVEPIPDEALRTDRSMNQPQAVSEPIMPARPMLTVLPLPPALAELGNKGPDGSADAERRT